MKLSALACIVVLLATFASAASAFEFESAVPLTIGKKLGNLNIGEVRVDLDGKSVTIDARIDNDGTSSVKDGYFAYTPLFNRLGVGEENYPMDFKDLRVWIDSMPVALKAERRGFFLGKDITAVLQRVGLDPLPDENANSIKIRKLSRELGSDVKNGLDWQGFVSYAWEPVFPPSSSSAIRISYTALPQFSLEREGSEKFRQFISQHCGAAESLGTLIKSNHPGAEYVLMERYDIPLSFVDEKPVSIKVSQPETNWAGVHPVASLACGLESDHTASTSLSGQITVAPRGALSILVISVAS